ncbi:hypothetical protein MATL_G00254760 [Megalops atlanticus]|uniref:DNA repair-scaffolding protein n=1 Tax=Megalops atlanticus TaxID=7932 RepID=A0A9D3PA11_MEGAT|nr:hypothetical protein MATL_G00254760 [Megalops atlanticus]
MSVAKRKRNSKDIRSLCFPDDLKDGFKKVAPEGRSTSSAIKSWERRGEGFLGTPAAETLHSSGRKLSAARQLVPCLSTPVREKAACEEALIVWSSSESESSDIEAQRPEPSTAAVGRHAAEPRTTMQFHSGAHKEAVNSYHRYLGLIRSLTTPKEDELHEINWDSDLSNDAGEVEVESLAEISDSDSCPREPNESPKRPLVTDAEISDYSDDESVEPAGQARCEHVPWQPSGNSVRSASDWVRSAQAVLRTPQKQDNRQFKTPEDSAKKKKKFLSGGLAERLSRLQCRQRSAISFWRHQSLSDGKTPAAGKAGVLVLKLLSVWGECSMQAALCERDTATHLAPSPGDIIHVHPPWQKLVVEGESRPVILNTHFSQRILLLESAESRANATAQASADKCVPYPLTRVFSLTGKSDPVSEKELPTRQVEPQGFGEGVCDSLLEVIEGQGLAGGMGRDVSVVVQRVYCLQVQQPSRQHLLKHRAPRGDPVQQHGSRLCFLVQDYYGMFSEVMLHTLSSEEDSLQEHIRKWEGRSCVLRGMKVVQRVTRGRSASLFSLIDSLWPPMVPLRVHGKSQGSQDDKSRLPAPSFCYLLAGQRGQDSVDELLGSPAPGLYLPVVVHTLREILQRVPLSHRCSFMATVIYKRLQSAGPGRGEDWLFVTDPGLQQGEPEPEGDGCRRTVPVCVSAPGVLSPAVLQALSGASACSLTIKDAVKEHGAIRVEERSVVQLEPLALVTSPDGPTNDGPLSQPARLDQLGPTTQANSLCTLKGVVVGVDEDTAYSWPVCNLCESDRLEASHGERQTFFCTLCNTVVDKPTIKMQLDVFLSCLSFSHCTVKIKLQQDTIRSLLNSTSTSDREGYEVENVLGKEVGPLAAYVRVVTRKPALWIGLEEISL